MQYGLLFLITVCTLQAVKAQQVTVDVNKDVANGAGAALYQTVNGEPFTGFKFVKLVEGSPYFSEEWMEGELLLEKSVRCKGRMRLDLYSNNLLYTDRAGNEFIATMPGMRQLLLRTTDSSYLFYHTSTLPALSIPTQVQWLQLLQQTDSLQLYKAQVKELRETKPYSSATVEQTIRTTVFYVIIRAGQALSFQKAKAVPALFAPHRAALEAFLKNNKTSYAGDDHRMMALALYLQQLLAAKTP